MIWIIIGIVIATPFVLYVVSNDLLTFADVFWGVCDAIGSAIMTAFSAYFRFFDKIWATSSTISPPTKKRKMTLAELEKRSVEMERECGLVFDEHGFLLPGLTDRELEALMVAQYGPDFRDKVLVSAFGSFRLADVFDECGLEDPSAPPRTHAAYGLWQMLPPSPHPSATLADQVLAGWRLASNRYRDYISPEQHVEGPEEQSSGDPGVPVSPEDSSRNKRADERDDETDDGEKHD